MSSGSTEEDIISALKDSGYLVEQEVASQLEALGYHVFTNWPFEDADEGKSREVDVRAIRRFALNEPKKLGAFIEIIVECKNSGNPIVFIERPKNEPDMKHTPMELVFPIPSYSASKPIENGSAHSALQGAVQQALTSRRGVYRTGLMRLRTESLTPQRGYLKLATRDCRAKLTGCGQKFRKLRLRDCVASR
jgi:hypothetical protein